MDIFFKSWNSVLRVLLTAIITYPALVIALRLVGKRSLSKLNLFDFMVTVAVGSTFGAVIIYESITVFDGIVTIGVLLLGQALISRLTLASDFLEKVINPKPTLLYHKDEFLRDMMKAVHVSQAEILAEMRQAGYVCLEDVEAVVLESNGIISVLGKKDDIKQSTLLDVIDMNADVH